MKTLLMSMRVTETTNYTEIRNSIAYQYIDFFEALGYNILLIPNNTKNLELYFNYKVDLVVLTGGNNVNPSLYGSDDLLNDVYPLRDQIEQNILDLAIKNNISIIGICRGFQFINVYFGGSIVHNIHNHVNKNHLLLSDNSILSNRYVNSFHNQGIVISTLSPSLSVLACSEDGYVEAYINKNKKVLGIQWHPERQDLSLDKRLIENFIKGTL